MTPKKSSSRMPPPEKEGRAFPAVRPDDGGSTMNNDINNHRFSSGSGSGGSSHRIKTKKGVDDDDILPPPLPKRPTYNAPPVPSAEMPLAREPPQPPSASDNNRASLRPSSILTTSTSTTRAVTPDPLVLVDSHARAAPSSSLDPSAASLPHASRGGASTSTTGSGSGGSASASASGRGRLSPQSSPRIIPRPGGSNSLTSGPGAGAPPPPRRQGVVFNDTPTGSLDSSSSSPPPRQSSSSLRPRTHTMDGAFRQQIASATDGRHRVGSFSSPGSLPVGDDPRSQPPPPPPPPPSAQQQSSSADLSYYSSTAPAATSSDRPPDLQMPFPPALGSRDKKRTAARRLTKKPSSRPSSPHTSSAPPSVDALPLPLPTNNISKILMLMRSLCGKMRGDVEFRRRSSPTWRYGVCYIDEDRGSLMYDSGETEPPRASALLDLRGCRVQPVDEPDKGMRCLEIAASHPGAELRLCPLLAEEFDWWLAALLCWQQLRPAAGPKASLLNARGAAAATTTSPPSPTKPRASSSGSKDPAIIKIGQVELWDKGLATSPRAVVKRPSTRDPQASWRWVSCILQDDGEFRLMTESDGAALAVVELSQLSRCAIRRLDRSVLDREFCVGLFPVYASAAARLSIFRPVYIALESRVLFEVWFVILRAFAVPDLYRLDPADRDQILEVADLDDDDPPGDVFRLERTMTVRVTEAKIRRPPNFNPSSSDLSLHDHRHRTDQGGGGPVGSYLAEVLLDGDVGARTATRCDTRNPFWREESEFVDLPSALPAVSVILKRSDNGAEVLCGTVDVPLPQPTTASRGSRENEHWLPIYDERQQSVGTMLVRVSYDEFVVLFSREYRRVSELLHRFSTGLTVQIALARPRRLRRIAEILLNIFQVSGSVTEWLMSLAEDEIDGISNPASLSKPRFSRRLKSSESLDASSDREQILRDMGKSLAGEANLLFRGNSLLTQALEFHMRRLGKDYLVDTLADKIAEMNDINPDCEVDPSKLLPGEDLRQHWSRLLRYTGEVWDCIAASADRAPPELRHILKYIRAVADDRYGDFLRTVTYTSVSGFFFLRFLCPAILNPKLFGLLREHPRPGAQRTLTLIAKGLQALANLSTIGKKEAWMEPMNRFLGARRQPLKDFLDQVCAIPIERAGGLAGTALPAPYSTPLTILGRLSPTAREGFPSLPYLVDDARNLAALVKLWADDSPVSDITAHEYDNGLLEFNALCLAIQKRADDCHARIESLRLAESASQSQPTEPDQLSLTDVLEHASLVDNLAATASSSFGSGSAPAWAAEYYGTSSGGTRRQHHPHHFQPDASSLRPPGSSGSDVDGSGGFLGGGGAISSISSSGGRGPARRGRDHPSSLSLRGYAAAGSGTGGASSDLGSGGYGGGSGSGGSGGSGSGGTMKGLRDGRQARKLLSGLIRKSRTASPETVATTLSAPGGGGGRERERELYLQSRDRDGERERNREVMRGMPEPAELERD